MGVSGRCELYRPRNAYGGTETGALVRPRQSYFPSRAARAVPALNQLRLLGFRFLNSSGVFLGIDKQLKYVRNLVGRDGWHLERRLRFLFVEDMLEICDSRRNFVTSRFSDKDSEFFRNRIRPHTLVRCIEK